MRKWTREAAQKLVRMKMKWIKAVWRRYSQIFQKIWIRSESSRKQWNPPYRKLNDWFIWKFYGWVELCPFVASPSQPTDQPFPLATSSASFFQPYKVQLILPRGPGRKLKARSQGWKWSSRYITQLDDWFMARVILEILNFPRSFRNLWRAKGWDPKKV